MFGNKKLKKEIALIHSVLIAHQALTMEFVDVIKDKLTALNDRVSKLEAKRTYKKKPGPKKKRVKEEQKKQVKKVFGFRVKKGKKKNDD